jgi:hypothetical protein
LKTFILILQLKQSRKLYNRGHSKLFKFYFGTEVYFFYFWFLVEKGEREELSDSDCREKHLSLIPIYTTKIRDFCVKLFHLMPKVHIRCFYILIVCEKTYLSSSLFLISGWVRFSGFFRSWLSLSWFLGCFIGVLSKE